MDFSWVYWLTIISAVIILIALVLIKGLECSSKEFVGISIFIFLSVVLTVKLFLDNTKYTPFSTPDDMKKGLMAEVIKVPPNVFFIKSQEGRIFLVRSNKKQRNSIPQPGNKIVFTRKYYEIISSK